MAGNNSQTTGDGLPTYKRRRMLQLTGAAGLASAAGCVGELVQEDRTYRYITAPSDSMHFAMASQVSSVLSQHSDHEMQLQAGSGGEAASQLLRGETDLGHFDTIVGQRANAGEGEWADVEKQHTPLQVLSMYFIGAGLVTKVDSDLEYYTDMEGRRIGPGPADAAYWVGMKMALEKFIDYEGGVETRHSPPSQLGNDLASDAVEASGGPMYINGLVPSYINQMYAGNEVRMLGWREEEVEAIEEDGRIAAQWVANEDLGEDIDEFVMEPETFMVAASYPMWATDEFSEDIVYEMLETLWANKGELLDGHAAFQLWQEDDFWMSLFTPLMPVHPGAASFYQDQGIWDDQFEIG